MWYLYLDESGDLGFDFVNKHPSKFFTVTILAVSTRDANRKIINAVKKTIRRKLNNKAHRGRIVQELKGTGTTLAVKKYFYNQVAEIKFGLYAVTLNKKKVYYQLTKDKSKIYNYIARQVLDKIPFEKNRSTRVELILDKSMPKPEIFEFNTYISYQLQGRLSPKTFLYIAHRLSHENYGLQAVDIFCWGIFQQHERNRGDWYDVFQEKIIIDDDFL